MTGKHTARAMPDGVKRFLLTAAVILGIVAAGGNLGHVFDFATNPQHGKAGDIMGGIVALLPDVLLILSLIKLRYDWRSPAAWAGLGLSVGFVGWAAVRMTSGVDGRIVGLAPLVAACVAALLLELSGTGREASLAPVTGAPPGDVTAGGDGPVTPPVVGPVVGPVTEPVTEGVTGPVTGPVADAPDTRGVILDAITAGPCTVAALVQVTGRSRSTVVDHLGRLERDREAVKGKDGTWRARTIKAVPR